MKKLLYPTLVLIIFIIINCNISYLTEKIDMKTVQGKYISNFGNALSDSIVLHSDSTFIHYYHLDSNFVYIDTGKWSFSFDTTYDEYSIDLDDFIIRHPQIENEYQHEKYPTINNCLIESEDSFIDTTKVSLRFSFYKLVDKLYFDYCFSEVQYYYKTLNSKDKK